MDDRYALRPYFAMIDDFLAGRSSAEDFASRYIRFFKSDLTERPDRVFRVLDGLFADADFHEPNPELRNEHSLDDAAFRERVVEANRQLSRYRPSP